MDSQVLTRPAPKAASLPPSAPLLSQIITLLSDNKAQDITTVSLLGKASFADYMVIACGTSQRHLDALAQYLQQGLEVPTIIEGQGTSDWVLVDAGDIIVHLFRPEVREFYNLEKIWEMDM
jgi:ribosome-associated protein